MHSINGYTFCNLPGLKVRWGRSQACPRCSLGACASNQRLPSSARPSPHTLPSPPVPARATRATLCALCCLAWAARQTCTHPPLPARCTRFAMHGAAWCRPREPALGTALCKRSPLPPIPLWPPSPSSPRCLVQIQRSWASTSQTSELMPTVTRVVDVKLAQRGRWEVYCQVHDHFMAGMRATLVVR